MKGTRQPVFFILAVGILSLSAHAGQDETSATSTLETNLVLRATGTNIVMRHADFDSEAISNKVKKDMTEIQVLKMLGQPKELRTEDGFVRWFYTYEFPDAPRQQPLQGKWMILMVEFKDRKTTGKGIWLPHA